MTGNNRTMFLAAVALIATALTSAPDAQVSMTPEDSAALQQWTLNVEGYLEIRQQAVRVAPLPRISSDPAEFLMRRMALAVEIRARRAGARVGDLFTTEVGRTFRKQIARALTDHQIAIADLLADLRSETMPGAPLPAVNERFAWQLGAAMPPCVLAALPELPKELQYRLVGRDLILIDLDATLVIDILPGALPRPAMTKSAATSARE
jgi:hypothetical protein